MKHCAFLLSLLLAFLIVAPAAHAQSESYNDVMVIINDSSWHSRTIGNYFASRRSIPSWHICHINADTSETIDSLGFLRLKWQMETWMRVRNLTDSINYIVTTKGCPLRVWVNLQDNTDTGPYSGLSSFEDCVTLMNGADSVYILTPKYVRRQSRYFGATSRFQHHPSTMPFYLVTRLDGYTVAQVEALIRSAESTVNPAQGLWVFDMDPSKTGSAGLMALNTYMSDADSILRGRGLSTYIDNTLTYLHNKSNVLGYASWGSNDGSGVDGYTARPQNTWASGSIAETYVSSSGRSFMQGTGYGQSLIADIIAEGVSAAKGYTDEPYATSMAHIDILVDRYTHGFAMAESFYAASRWAGWRQVIIGDPKMKLYMPAIAVAGPTSFCEGDTSVVLTAPTGYARQVWSTGDTSRTITVRTSGSYTVTMYSASGYNATSLPAVITVHPKPAPQITPAGTRIICEGDSVILSADTGYTAYRWSTGATTRSITVRSAGMYAVHITNQFGCSRTSDSSAVIVRPRPQPVITPLGPTVLCAGDSVVLDAGAGYASYRWMRGDTSRKITVRSSGSYRVTVTNQFGCPRESDSLRVTVNQRPVPKISARGNRIICRGDAVLLESDSIYTRYRWSTGDTTRAIYARETGDYHLIATNTYGCSARSDTIHIQVDELPDASIAGPEAVCVNSTATYAVPDNRDVSYTWLVSGGGGAIIAGEFTNSIRLKWGATGAGIVSLLAIDNTTGCQSNAEIGVDIGSSLVPVIHTSRSPMLCPGGSVELSADSGYASYRWSTGAIVRSIVVNTPGSYTVSVVDAGGCSGTSEPVAVRINEPPKPVVTAPGGTKACVGQNLILDAGIGYRSYTWSTGATTRTIAVGASGSYSVTVTDSAGCAGTSQPVVATFHALPTPVIEGSDAVCSNSTVTYSTASGSYSRYEWSVSNGTILTGQNSGVISVQWPASGSSTVALRATSAEGCSGTSSPYVVTIGTSLHPSITPSGSITMCAGDSTLLSAPAGYASYQWSTGDRTRSIVAHKAGAYFVNVADAGGCSGTSDPVTVSLRAVVLPTVAPSGTVAFCEGDSVRLEAAGGFTTYRWSNGGTERSAIIRKSGAYSVEVYDSAGCHGVSQPVQVIVYAAPVVPIIIAHDDTLLTSGSGAYQWYYRGAIISDAIDSVYIAGEAGAYSVQVKDINGCSATSLPFEFVPPAPPAPASTLSLPILTASPGEHIVVPLTLANSRDLDRAGRHSFSATIRLDASILLPVDSAIAGVIVDGQRIIHLEGLRPSGMAAGTLAWLEFVAVGGGADSTVLALDSFEWNGDGVEITTQHGLFRLLPASAENPLTISLGPYYPNPASASVLIEYSLIEDGTTRLTLADNTGRHIATLINEPMKPGRYTLRFTTEGLPSGLYFLALQTPTVQLVRGMVVAR
jgi:uncharacterized protein (TIGR03790 family)